MCLISVLPKGTEKYNEKTISFIRKGATTNTDGSGFMFKRENDDCINIKKGFFNITDMLEEIKKLNLKKEDELVIHHRIGTSGEICAKNTHPFLIYDDDKLCSETDLTINKPALVHNGMFSGIRDFMSLNPKFCDTYAFARYIISEPGIYNLIYDNYKLFELLFKDILSFNKVCILDPNKGIKMLGNFFEDDGYFHSNGGYKDFVYDRGGSSDNVELALYDSYKPKALSIVGNNKYHNTQLYYDSSEIKIDKYNVHHFFFIKKSVYNINSESYDVDRKNSYCLYEIDDISEDTEFQILKLAKSSTNYTIKMDNIKNDYFYIPKPNFFDSYLDLEKIKTLFPDYSKNSFKQIQKILIRSRKKGLFDKIKYSKTERLHTKLTLSLYRDYLEMKNLKDKNNKVKKAIPAIQMSFSD